MSVPNSVIHILAGIPLNNSYEHSLYFETKNSQEAYFLSKITKTFDSFTYLKPENKIKVAGDIANARTWNYLMFQNDRGKWYYHFIDKVVYLNDSAVELHITLDLIQTFMFDWKLNPCFVERMHTETDAFGEHTVPEGLETGPLVRIGSKEVNLEDNVILILMACNENGGNAYSQQMYGGVYCGLMVYAVKPTDIVAFNNWLEKANTDGYIEGIVSMWMYPKALVNVANNWEGEGPLHRVTGVNDSITVEADDPLLNATSIDGWVVNNKKTLCYPYTMVYVSNNMGSCAIYHREQFEEGGNLQFKVYGALSPDSGVQMVPKSYKTRPGGTYNFEEALSMPAFPTCAWNSDTYKVWLAQNQNQHELAHKQAVIQAGAGALTAVASAFTGNIIGAVGGLATSYSALTSVQNLMAQKADMDIQPAQARGNHSGNINLTHGRMGFSIYFMSITAEYAKIIDQYFTRYGYKLNEVMTPKLHTRELFTYIKTVGSLVTGNLGAEDQLKIQNIFDKGITFWADPRFVGSYYNSNKPLGEV